MARLLDEALNSPKSGSSETSAPAPGQPRTPSYSLTVTDLTRRLQSLCRLRLHPARQLIWRSTLRLPHWMGTIAETGSYAMLQALCLALAQRQNRIFTWTSM